MRFSLPTRASAAQAFDLVADFGRLDEWEPTVASSEWVEGQWPEPGAKARLVLRRRFSGAEMLYTLEDVEPGRMARYRGGTTRVHSVDTFTFVDRARGSVILMESQISTSGRWSALGSAFRFSVGALGSSVVVPALRRRLAEQG